MNIIYLRTSTEEQNPENQLKDCLELVKKLKLEDYELFEEKQSAFKDTKREVFGNIEKLIKKRKVKAIICWDLDRLFRNRKKLIEFFELCKVYDCKIYSFRQDWLESLKDIPEPFNEMMHGLMIQVMGWLAEDESKKKSDRVKMAIRKVNGVTKSYKGNKWGRKKLKKVDKQILELRNQGKTIRQISKAVYYWDNNNHKKYVSTGYVHKCIDEKRNKK